MTKLTRAEIEALRRIRDGISPLKRHINNPSGGQMLQRMKDRGLIKYDAGWHRTPLGVAVLDAAETLKKRRANTHFYLGGSPETLATIEELEQ